MSRKSRRSPSPTGTTAQSSIIKTSTRPSEIAPCNRRGKPSAQWRATAVSCRSRSDPAETGSDAPPHPGRLLSPGTQPRPVQPSRRAIVEVLHAGLSLQPGALQTALQRPVLPTVPLAINPQTEPLLEAQLMDIRLLHLPLQGFGHTTHAHGTAFIDRRLVQDNGSSWLGGSK